jgi:transposase
MRGLSSSARVFVCEEPMDMRCGRYRLAAKVKEVVREDPLSGYFFVFFNKPRTSVKVLSYERGGYRVWHKVLRVFRR